MADDTQDRRLPATARKIEKARTEGQVARSRDLGHMAAFGAFGLILVSAAPELTDWLRMTLAAGLSFDAASVTDPQAMFEQLAMLVGRSLLVVLPIGFILAVAAFLSGTLTGGWNFTLKAMQPKFSKVNPLAGIKRMVSGQQLAEMLKASFLALVLGVIGALYLRWRIDDIPQLLALPLPTALSGAGDIVFGGLLLLILALGAFALVDVPLQRQLLLRRLRMSHEEVKKEHKDVEGNVEVKGKIRARMRSLANRRMIAAVPGADVVVMNPTHYAVALKYEEGSMGAPRVVAKGADLLALRIRDAARDAGVPVLQAPPLARALYAHCEVDQEVPALLFSAVAQVLAWVYQLRAAVAGQAPMPAVDPTPVIDPELDPAHGAVRRRGRQPRGKE